VLCSSLKLLFLDTSCAVKYLASCAAMHTKMHISLHVKYQLFLTILSKTALVREFFF